MKLKRKLFGADGRLGSLNDRRATILLGVVAVLTHFHWLFDPHNFTSGDWQFVSQAQYRSFVNFSPVWVTNGFGSTSATPAFYLVRWLEGLLTLVGSNFAINEKLFFFIPVIFIGSFGAYIFLRQYFKEWPSFIGAIVFAFNTAMLFNYAGALTIAVTDALTPITIYLFQLYLRRPDSNKLLILNSFALAIMTVYELRITLLVLAIAGALFVFSALTAADGKQYVIERLWPLTKLGLLLGCLQAFWVLPYVISSRSGVTFSNNLSVPLFVSFSDVQNALTLHHPFWTNARPATFIVQPIPWYAWLIPLAAFGGLIFQTRTSKRRDIAFWAFIGLIGIFLVKQVNVPLVVAYPWLFGHIPGFAAFRESSKFYLFVALSYAVLIPFTLTDVREWLISQCTKTKILSGRMQPIIWLVISGGVLCLFAVNMKPLLSGEFATTYLPHTMPADYAKLQTFINAQPNYFRLLWVPTASRWGVQSNLHPSVEANNLGQSAWLTDLSTINLGPSATERNKSLNIFGQASSSAALDRASIKYVVVPIRDTQSQDDFFKYYGDDRQYFINQLNQVSYLRRINIGTSQLAVYENQTYDPHVTTATNVQSLDVAGEPHLDPLFTFISQQLHTAFNFVARAKASTSAAQYPRTDVDDVFQNLTRQNLQQNAVTKTFQPEQHPLLYIDTASRSVRYAISNNVITFYSQTRNDLLVNDSHVGPDNSPAQISASAQLRANGQYYLDVNGSIVSLKPRNGQGNLGVLAGPLALYAASGGNVVPDGSFEQGLWRKKVEDCNNYDNNAHIDMRLDNSTSTNGHNSLQLAADQHTACTTSQTIPANAKDYLFDFNYLLNGGQTAGYKIIFDDPKHTVVAANPAGGKVWKTYQRVVPVPAGATSFTVQLMGYPDYRLENHATTNYDSVNMLPLASLVALPTPPTRYTKAELPANTQLNFSYSNDDSQQGKNLISNGSFGQGLWRKKVADCDNYDGNPDIAMRLIPLGNSKALQLSARRHAACTSTNVPVKGNANYILSFDYQSPNTTEASYTIVYNDKNHTAAQGTIPIKDHDWHTFTLSLQPPLGATNMLLTVNAFDDGTGLKDVIDNYDNFSLKETPVSAGQYYLVNVPQVSLKQPRRVTFNSESATKDTIKVQDASTPFYLAMSESYNPLWRLELNNNSNSAQGFLAKLLPWTPVRAVANGQHFDLNDFENGWYIDPAQLCKNNPAGCTREADGSYDIKLVAEFTPQRWFYVGSAVSILAVAGSVGYLWYVRRRKNKVKRVYHRR